MKDTQTKPVSPTPKTKPGLKKVKMPAKKIKEPKLSLAKISKGKKNQNLLDKKIKTIKEDSKDAPKRKRGRPRNDDKPIVKKLAKEPKGSKNEIKLGRKRKSPQNGTLKSERNSYPPSKKLKTSDISFNMNGNIKMPPSVHKPVVPKTPTIVSHTVTNNCSNGGTVLGKKNVEFPMDKPTLSTASKTVTFHPNTKSEVLNGNGTLAKPFKSHPATKNVKSILKNDAVAVQPKESPQAPPKEAKNEKTNNLFNPSPVKLHPQRMASLDALAKMHVICIPDRRPVEHHSKATTSMVSVCSEPFTHQKSLTQCHERIQFDLKKESKDSKGNLVHKQINYVKEKQQVFVSHSVEQSKTVSTIDQEKGKKKSAHKPSNSASAKEAKLNQNATKSLSKVKGEKSKTKGKDPDQKSAKSLNKAKVIKKNAKDNKLVPKGKKTKKVEQTKSEVKVKETIRMQKTCTYQSVTTVNSHATTNSSVVPVSHVGLTTNYSKTKKTVVTDEECKNKMNYSSGSVVNNSYCVTSESPCSVGHHSDYYKFHAHSTPPLIPFAHVQACTLGHGLNRTSDSSASSSASHCDGNFAVHRFGHQQAVIYSPSTECSCCCSNSLVQNLHDSCLLRKSIVAYPHPHHPSSSFTSEALCPDYNPSLDLSRHRSPPPTPHFPPSCCCDPHHLSPYRPMPSPKSPCEQSPLDLSLASSNSSGGLETPHCPSSLCCTGAREVLLVRTASTPCCRGAAAPQAKEVGGFVPAKREKSVSPKQPLPKVPLSPKKKQFAHGWSWKGKPREKMITLTNDSTPCPRMCYPSVQHEEGDVINEKDCVLLRSGPKDTDLPYVAKIAAFWENPDDGEMMMSLLWYYRPEHTDQGRKPGQMEDEVFASKHKDVNSIACIEDKCYVLTYNEYCRYRASLTMDEDTYSIASLLVPEPSEGYPRKSRLPIDPVSSDIVFVCRYVYDFRQKRTLKNPT